MYKIAVTTEDSLNYSDLLKSKSFNSSITTTNAIGRSTCYTAQDLDAAAIITATSSGATSRAISKFRPKSPILAVTTTEEVMRKLAIEWGVYPVLAPESKTTDEVISNSVEASISSGFVKEGDLVVITAGIPVGLSGSTNLIKVQTIGKVLLTGTGIGVKSISGKVCIANTREELFTKFDEGNILVCVNTDKDMVKFMERAGAIVTEHGGLTSHGAIVGLNLEKPTIVGAAGATTILEDGDIVTVDSATGQIYKGEARVL